MKWKTKAMVKVSAFVPPYMEDWMKWRAEAADRSFSYVLRGFLQGLIEEDLAKGAYAHVDMEPPADGEEAERLPLQPPPEPPEADPDVVYAT